MHLGLPQFALGNFFDFLMGPAIATRVPAPSLSVLMIAERKAWREVVLKMHRGETLETALSMAQQDGLFWTREVYERVNSATTAQPMAPTSANTWPTTPRRGL